MIREREKQDTGARNALGMAYMKERRQERIICAYLNATDGQQAFEMV
jgi:hypothetical protein